MYEGKNIHYSQTADQKPLCSFSGKICNQRRLNHYGFCVRHILEDPTAPFKRCAYVAKSSGQTCTQPIPKNEEREYCNNHMQVLGMLPKKERKPKKEKERPGTVSSPFYLEGAKSDPGLLQNKIRPRPIIGNTKTKLIINKMSLGEEMEDVYAFPADSSETRVKELTAVYSSVTLPNVSVSVSPVNVIGANVTKSHVDAGQSSLAKIYPELAEKLEKIKPKVEAKTKGKVKSSRTMNSLQTKIAQNKIKDKLKRNQCSSNTSSQSQSPSHSHTSSPGYQINSSSPNHSTHSSSSPANSAPPNVTVVRDGLNSVGGILTASGASSCVNVTPTPSLSQLNVLNGLNLQTLNLSLEQLGLPVPTVSDIEQTLKQLASAANIPLEGNAGFDSETGVTEPQMGPIVPTRQELQHVLPQTFTAQSKPPPPYSSVHHKPSAEVLQTASASNLTNTISQTDHMNKVKNEFIGHQIRPVTNTMASSPVTSQIINAPFVTRQHLPTAPQSGVKFVPTSSSALSSSLSSSSSLAASLSSPALLPQHPKLTLLTTSQTPNGVSSRGTESAKQSSNVAGFQQPKSKPTKSRVRSRNPSSTTKRPVPVLSVPMTLVKPRKIRKLLDDEDVKKLKTKSAIEYYNQSKQKKINHHYMVCSSVASSDESDLSDCDMLPWQPDWFRESSDEEAAEDEEESDYDLRTAKLALGRARFRRQCYQARLSGRLNHNAILTTSSLISAARESSKAAVKCLREISCVKAKSPERLKSKGLVKRRCLYRDDEEKQCKNNVVPYTNHCIKHVMYNVDQQLFEYCTAKFADNTQCCHPVIDMKHELPLCMEHGVKADNFLKAQDLEPKPKRPRKKTKPSALTRPPKKGKKKKNQRKNVRPQKPLPPDVETQESETDDLSSQPHTEVNMDSESDKGESQSSITDVPESEKPVLSAPTLSVPETSINQPTSMVVKDGVKVGLTGMKERKSGSASQLEELDNLTSLSELENVKMFGDLETTASKLLEENDFQEVFSRLPDVAFDIFNSKSSGLPGTDELQDFEDSLALANRELKMTKDSQELVVTCSSKIPITCRQSVQTQASLIAQAPVTSELGPVQPPVAPILEDSDDLTRQIAEEIMKQNIGPSVSMGESLCNGDAEESIKAIARSLSNSGMMLAAEAKHKVQPQEVFTSNQSNLSLSRAQSLPVYSNIDSIYYPPNVALQNIPATGSQQVSGLVPTCVLSKGPGQNPQGQVSYTGSVSTNVVPQNVTVTPQGIITSHFGSARLAPSTQTVTIGNTTVTGNQTAGIITLPVQQQLTAQQLSALVQQAAAHLPPLPPYTPRQQTQTPVSASSQAAHLTSVASQRPLSQEQLIQHLAKQQEQLGEQQQLLAQQILQQRLAVLTQQHLPMKVSLPSTQNLGFSTILHQGPVAQLGRPNQGVVHSIPNIGQITQMIKTTLPTSQKVIAPGNSSLPSTNIVWTSPPNVTITSPNGLPRSVAQTFVSGAKVTTTTNQKSKSNSINETFIDLTEPNDPPPYDAALTSHGKTQPPPSYPAESSTNSTVTGKS